MPKPNVEGIDTPPEAKSSFSIRLRNTYYSQGVINPGIEASRFLGANNEMLVIHFDDGTPSIKTRIDRKANASGSVRLIGNNKGVADGFNRNFQLDDIVKARILGPNEIELVSIRSTED